MNPNVSVMSLSGSRHRHHTWLQGWCIHCTILSWMIEIYRNPRYYDKGFRVSSFFLRVQLSQPYVATGHTSAFISRIFVEIGMLWLFHIFCSDAPIACPLLTWYGILSYTHHLLLSGTQGTEAAKSQTACDFAKYSPIKKFSLAQSAINLS